MKDTAGKKIFHMQAETARVISNASRLMILHVLQNGEMTVSELADTLKASQSSISQHLAIMRSKGILKSRRDGVVIYYYLKSLTFLSFSELLVLPKPRR